MKPGRFERSWHDTIPPKNGVHGETSNLTELSRSSSKIPLNCDMCGIRFEKYACWAKRTNHHYCGRGCANEAKKRIAERRCIECGKTMLMIPSYLTKISTCSAECSSERRKKHMLNEVQNMANSTIYNYGIHEKGSQVSVKLDEDMVRAIRSDNRSQAKIAREYGIGQTTVSHIKLGRTWRHVKD